MKKMVFIAGALMLVVAGSAMAGSDLGWNDCVAGGGTADRTVVCTNTGSAFLYGSLNPSVSYPTVGATDLLIDVAPVNPPGPWWNPPVTSTRYGSAATDPVSGTCFGWWGAAPNGGITFQPPQGVLVGGGTKLRVKVTTVIGAGEEQPMDPGTDYFMGALSLKFNAGTLGNAECTAGGALGIADIIVYQPNQPDGHEGQVAATRNCSTFRNPPTKQCPGATPTEKSTWGSIKALYR
jgi:hypothetical protein